MSFTDVALDLFASQGAEGGSGRKRAEAYQAFGEEFAGPHLQILHPQFGHHLEDMLALTDMGALIGPNKVGDMRDHRIVPLTRLFDQRADGLEHADLAEQVDLR